MTLLIDILGWIGAFEVVLAYGLNSYQKLRSDSMTFQLLNITGGILVLINAAYKGALPSAFINAVWIVIAGGAIIRILVARQRS